LRQANDCTSLPRLGLTALDDQKAIVREAAKGAQARGDGVGAPAASLLLAWWQCNFSHSAESAWSAALKLHPETPASGAADEAGAISRHRLIG